MSELKRQSRMFIWTATPAYLVVSVIPGTMVNISHGWPRVPISELGPEVTTIRISMILVVANLPDVLSIAIYLRMWRELRKKQQQQDEIVQEEEDPFGGIWVGDQEVVIENQEDAVVPFNVPWPPPPPPTNEGPLPAAPPVQRHNNSQKNQATVLKCFLSASTSCCRQQRLMKYRIYTVHHFFKKAFSSPQSNEE